MRFLSECSGRQIWVGVGGSVCGGETYGQNPPNTMEIKCYSDGFRTLHSLPTFVWDSEVNVGGRKQNFVGEGRQHWCGGERRYFLLLVCTHPVPKHEMFKSMRGEGETKICEEMWHWWGGCANVGGRRVWWGGDCANQKNSPPSHRKFVCGGYPPHQQKPLFIYDSPNILFVNMFLLVWVSQMVWET